MANQDTVRIMCPNLTCRKILAVPVSARGKTVRCRGCATNIRVPDKSQAAASSVKAAPEAKGAA